MTKPFAAGWLDLREPYDRAARSRALLQSLTAWRQGRGRLQVVDLGAGTGANLRCTATALGGEQDWTLLELDPALIEAGRGRLAQATVGWHYRQLDLAIDLERSVDGGVDLITASALLDLVSEAWLERLVKLQRRTGAALLLVLSVDGRIAWTPMEADDRSVSEVVNWHQLTDKGFGPALGARAVEVLHGLLAEAAGDVLLSPSDWMLGHADQELQLALLAGYVEVAAGTVEGLDAWAARRRRLIATGESSLTIGHQDLLFLPKP